MWQPTESSPDTRLSQVPQKQYLQTASLIPGQTVTNFASPGLLQSEQRQYGSAVPPLPGQTFSTPLRMNRASSATIPSFKQPTYQQPGYIYNQRDTYNNQRYQYQTGEPNIDNLINKGQCEPSIVIRENVPIYCKRCDMYAKYFTEFSGAIVRRCRFCKIIIEVPNEYFRRFQYFDTINQYLKRLELLSDEFKYIPIKDYCKDMYNNQRYQYQTGEPNIDNLINKGECEPSVVIRKIVPIYCKRCDTYARYYMEFSKGVGRKFQCRFCKIIIEAPHKYFSRMDIFLDRCKRTELTEIRQHEKPEVTKFFD